MQLNVYIGVAQPDEWPHAAAMFAEHAQCFERLSGGVPCIIIPYAYATPEMLHHLAPRAVLISGIARPFAAYAPESFFGLNDWLQTTRTPTLAICGSHQLLGFMFNQDIRRMPFLPDQRMESLSNHDQPQLQRQPMDAERGWFPVTLTEAGKGDTLFHGINSIATLFEDHQCEIKRVPPGFRLLASTPNCEIQAICHATSPVYGVQFHPEAYSDTFPDGQHVLKNFLQLSQTDDTL